MTSKCDKCNDSGGYWGGEVLADGEYNTLYYCECGAGQRLREFDGDLADDE